MNNLVYIPLERRTKVEDTFKEASFLCLFRFYAFGRPSTVQTEPVDTFLELCVDLEVQV